MLSNPQAKLPRRCKRTRHDDPQTLNLLLETCAELVKAELALSNQPGDRLAIQASHWLFAWETERITVAMWRVGRVSRAALLHAQGAGLADEIKLLEKLKDTKRSEPFLMLPASLDGEASYYAEDLKELAEAGSRRLRPGHAISPRPGEMLSERVFKSATKCIAVARMSLEPISLLPSMFSWIRRRN